MTNPWTNVTGVIGDFNRAANSIIAAFQGRSSTFTISAFFGVVVQDLNVQFVDGSSSPGGAIQAWAWDFGDGATSTAQNPSHTYAAAGDYLVTLVITDASGGMGSHSVTVSPVEILPPPADEVIPVAGFTVATSSLTATFTDTSTDADGTVVAWNWDFGEGPTSAFTYKVTGLSSQFTNQATAPAPLTIASYAWSFGDGTTSSSSNTVHTYTAGGQKQVSLLVTANNGSQDTALDTVAVSSGVTTLGIPFGICAGAAGPTTIKTGNTHFNLFHDFDDPTNIVARIDADEAAGRKRILVMTGGAHTDYTTGGVWDASKWTAKQDTFNTVAIKARVVSAVSAGVVVGCSIVDEPFHSTFGPPGTLTKTSMDMMAVHVKSLFPNLPCGTFHGYQQFQPNSSYHTMDFIISAYQSVFGNITTWLNGTKAMCQRDNHKSVYGINVRDGGTFIPNCLTSPDLCCPQGTTEGVGRTGSSQYLCRAIPSQLTTWAQLLGPNGPGFLLWEWDTAYMSTSSWAVSNQSAFISMRSFFDLLPQSTWTRG